MSLLPEMLVARERATAAAAIRLLLLGGGTLLVVVLVVLLRAGEPAGSGPGWLFAALMLVLGSLSGPRHVGTLVGDLVALAALVLAPVTVGVLWASLGEAVPTGQTLMFVPVVAAAMLFRRPVAVAELVLCSAFLVLVPWLVAPEPGVLVALHGTTLAAGAALLTALLVRLAESRERLTAELVRMAAVDPLTGLVTRRVLDDALSVAIESVDTVRGSTLVLVDLDEFKAVNDRYGHPVGDQALCHLAGLVTAAMGAEGAVVSRLGGDELAAVLTGCSLEAGRSRAQALLRAVRATPLRLQDGRSVPLTVSVGLAHAPVHAVSVAALYQEADRALYRAKEGGRDQLAVAEVGPVRLRSLGPARRDGDGVRRAAEG